MDKVKEKIQSLEQFTEDTRIFQSWQFKAISNYYSVTEVLVLCSHSIYNFSKESIHALCKA